jgi:hypothetical protein
VGAFYASHGLEHPDHRLNGLAQLNAARIGQAGGGLDDDAPFNVVPKHAAGLIEFIDQITRCALMT